MDIELRDKIIEMHSDIKHIAKWSENHEKKDDERFDSVTKEIDSGKKIVYGGVGAMAVLEIILRLFKL